MEMIANRGEKLETLLIANQPTGLVLFCHISSNHFSSTSDQHQDILFRLGQIFIVILWASSAGQGLEPSGLDRASSSFDFKCRRPLPSRLASLPVGKGSMEGVNLMARLVNLPWSFVDSSRA
jgi:hypothetical protein